MSVVLARPADREKLEQALAVLADWCPLDQNEREAHCRHGDRVAEYAQKFMQPDG